MKQRQEQVLTQRLMLGLNQQLKLFIDMLPLNALELRERIEEEIIENPALEIDQENPEEAVLPSEPRGEEFFEFYYERDDEEEKASPLDFVAYVPDYKENIKRSFLPSFRDEKEREIAEALIDYLDWRGYLEEDEIKAVAKEKGVSLEEVELVRRKLLRLPPCGIGSRNLSECLSVQLEVEGKTDSLEYRLVSNEKFLELLAAGELEKLAAELGVTLEKVKSLASSLSKLEPYPAQLFSPSKAPTVETDISLEITNGEVKVEFKENDIPPLRISSRFLDMLNDPTTPPELKKYAKERINAAKQFIEALKKRNNVVKAIVNFIIERQKEFFLKGFDKEYLKPLTLKEVASYVGVHESTVSRIVSSRYISTPRHTYPLKFFFNSGIPSYFGSQISRESIKERIRKLIEKEPKENPYSDEEIVEMLRKQNINISRRTVAKYRSEMGIENANRRKKKYKMGV